MMNRRIYVSERADTDLIEYLKGLGEVMEVGPEWGLTGPLSCHPDIYMCALPGRIFFGDPSKLSREYPKDVLYNAAAVGEYLICSQYTDPELIEKSLLKPVFVKQGYCKCNLVVVDESHVITEDEGIAKALVSVEGIDCLLVTPHHIRLEGFPYGFIGGASGKIDDTVIFNGDLSAHPDTNRIRSFIEACGLKVKDFPGHPLTDIGSIIC